MSESIRNRASLATTPLRIDALAIANAAYEAIHAGKAVARKLRIEGGYLIADGARFSLAHRRIFFVGVGKCSLAAAQAIDEILGDRLTAGIALDVGRPQRPINKILVLSGTHPRPSASNTQAAGLIWKFLSGCTREDLVIMLISGGGSTLLCLHDAPMTCESEGALFDALSEKGASIQELNVVRKHLSKVRGGGLAAAAYPAEVLSLIISDVPGDDLQFIASGPTVRDSTTPKDAAAILARYDIPFPVGALLETPKDIALFARVTNVLFLTNADALQAMAQEAGARGYRARVQKQPLSGEASVLGARLAGQLHDEPPHTSLLMGGECTVRMEPLHGKGGRNQEIALAALAEMTDGELILPFASDGRDATEHAGAIADVETRRHADAQGLSAQDFLARHASFDFFAATGDALDTGVLESNVSDLLVALKA